MPVDDMLVAFMQPYRNLQQGNDAQGQPNWQQQPQLTGGRVVAVMSAEPDKSHRPNGERDKRNLGYHIFILAQPARIRTNEVMQ